MERRTTVAVCGNDSNHAQPSATKQNAASDPTLDAVNAVSQLLRRASTTNDNRRSVLTKNKTRDGMPAPRTKPLISPEEYGKLPASIQRKYFSSEERLQIAQRSAAERRQRQPSKKEVSDAPVLKSAPSCDFSKRRKTFRKGDSKKQRRSSLPSAFDSDIKDDSAWYEALPDKVKRSQFDNRERSAFLGRSSDNSDRPQTSSSARPTFDSFSFDKNRSVSAETPRIPPSPSIAPSSAHSPSPSVATSYSYESRSSNQRSALSRQQHSAHPPTPANSSRRTPEQERAASRRNFLLHPIPLPPPVLAPVSTLPKPANAYHLDIVVRLESDDDTEITPTQEMEMAQSKLKNLPPAWYDEKLDFGFDGEVRKPSTSTFDSWEHPRTLSPSISDTASSHGPMTPSSPAMHGQHFEASKSSSQPTLQQIIETNSSMTNFSHLQQPQEEPKPRRSKPKHLCDGFYEDQDPRQPYSITIHYDNQDPLALEALPVSDDMSGAHGAFAVHQESPSGFRKVLKVIRGH